MFQNSLLSFKSPRLCPYLYTLSLWAIFPPSLITIKCTHTLTSRVTLYREWTLTALLTYFLWSLLLYKLLPQKSRHSKTYPHFLFYSVYKWMKLKWSVQFPIIYHAWLFTVSYQSSYASFFSMQVLPIHLSQMLWLHPQTEWTFLTFTHPSTTVH